MVVDRDIAVRRYVMTELVQDILRLKKERNAIILAHVYQNAEIQAIADYTGDSLELAKRAAENDAAVIVFCGVRFMAETANILSPEKIVLLPEESAGCPMADMVDVGALQTKLAENPDFFVVAYVNTSAAVKALTDVCCTSANAINVIKSIPVDKKILFVPDKNLGSYIMEKTNREMELWQGYCPIHNDILVSDVLAAKKLHPEALVLAHPECDKKVLQYADYIDGTVSLIKYAKDSTNTEFIVVTEAGVLYQLETQCPDKKFYMVKDNLCCVDMKGITLAKVKNALETLEPKVIVPEEIRIKALASLKKMLEIKR